MWYGRGQGGVKGGHVGSGARRLFGPSAALFCSRRRPCPPPPSPLRTRHAHTGLPIRPAFSKQLPPRTKLRARLGMTAGLPAVLLVGGGEGMGKLEDTVEELERRLGGSAQVVVICGRNKKLLDRLQVRGLGLSQRSGRTPSCVGRGGCRTVRPSLGAGAGAQPGCSRCLGGWGVSVG